MRMPDLSPRVHPRHRKGRRRKPFILGERKGRRKTKDLHCSPTTECVGKNQLVKLREKGGEGVRLKFLPKLAMEERIGRGGRRKRENVVSGEGRSK